MYTGPKLTNDNLVFGYDTGYGIADNITATRFYPGEPTTNLITSDGLDFTVLGGYTNLNRAQVVDSNSPSGYACEMEVADGSAINNAARVTFGQNTNMPSSGNATVSVYAKFEGGASSNITPKIYNGSGTAWQSLSPLDGGSAYLTSEYRRFAYYGAITSNPGFSMTKGNSSIQTGQKTRWHSPQVELRGHATPFLSGSRSDTASLIDLNKTTSIDVSDMSFDSSAQPDFDGTDDHIVVSPSNIYLGTSLTYEVWIYPTGYNHSRMYLMDPRGDGNTSGTSTWFIFDYHQSPDTVHVVTGNSNIEVQSSNFSMPLNNWHHLVATRNANSWVIYHNGVSVGTGTTNTTSLTLNNNFRIGTYASGSSGQYFFEGLMAVAKIYNTGLSASEVTQNFNANKNRFNL